MNWKIWYTDNITIEGTTPEEWAAAPAEGVLFIAAIFGVDNYGRKLTQTLSGTDWYWMYDGQLYQNNESTWEIDYWVDNPAPEGSVSKKGKWTTNEDMEYVMSLAMEWIK
jgi:hypothetical protein